MWAAVAYGSTGYSFEPRPRIAVQGMNNSRVPRGAGGSTITQQKNRLILVIDDNPSIHQDFRKVLGALRSVSHLEAD